MIQIFKRKKQIGKNVFLINDKIKFKIRNDYGIFYYGIDYFITHIADYSSSSAFGVAKKISELNIDNKYEDIIIKRFKEFIEEKEEIKKEEKIKAENVFMRMKS